VSGGCDLTILRTTSAARATKQWVWDDRLRQWSCRTYAAGARLAPEERPVSSLAELAMLLQKISRDPTALVVRDALADAVCERLAVNPRHLILQRKHKKEGVDPTLVEVERRWMMIDIDRLPLPEWAGLADDPESVITCAIERRGRPVNTHLATSTAGCWCSAEIFKLSGYALATIMLQGQVPLETKGDGLCFM
jgi:hypothetical protein